MVFIWPCLKENYNIIFYEKIYTFILFLSVTIGFAQTPYYPATYYNTATGTGYTLKTQLYNIIKSTISSGDMMVCIQLI